MRTYGKIPVSFWTNKTKNLTDSGRVLACYLSTGQHTTMLGCFRLSLAYIADDLNWELVTVKKAINELQHFNWLSYDATTSWFFIHDFLELERVSNLNQGKCLQKLFAHVPHEVNFFDALVTVLLQQSYLTTGFRKYVEELQVHSHDRLLQKPSFPPYQEIVQSIHMGNNNHIGSEPLSIEESKIKITRKGEITRIQNPFETISEPFQTTGTGSETENRTTLSGKPDVASLDFIFKCNRTEAHQPIQNSPRRLVDFFPTRWRQADEQEAAQSPPQAFVVVQPQHTLEPKIDIHTSPTLSATPPAPDDKSDSKPSSLGESSREILGFLNTKAHRAYRPIPTNLDLIRARLRSGATVAQCYQIIAKKTREWKDDPKMNLYLRPATLFNATKFEQYVGELVVPPRMAS